MQPLVRAAALAALLAALGALGKTPRRKAPEPAKPASTVAPAVAASCGPRSLPEGDVCIPLPPPGRAPQPDGRETLPAEDTPLAERSPLVPRRPDRPAEVAAYRFPLTPEAAPSVLGGLDRPFDLSLEAGDVSPGPGAVLLEAASGEPVVSLSLEGQEGPAEVAFVGELVGATVVTAHLVRDGGRLRQLLLVHGNLERPSERAVVGAPLEDGDEIGVIGDSAFRGRTGLYLEARQLREGTSLGGLDASRLREDIVSVPVDIRNTLPLR
ncbi:hypothetical protein [Polyangium spumosum]|uniref:Peptidoglycan DD-metalloendopeptidase family protein n=1 Tax=Polyangium spumosum TaxID=889282 RepID=A0A6N7PTF4_9BACT|nr:hypothetical protein [Polyangium spumosum]MRG94867.1 hypothetical protein [Polyangium spumosum]